MKKQLLVIALLMLPLIYSQAQKEFTSISTTPPMGWNSYDAYHGAITEDQFKACVDWLADNLLPLGYEYAVIDFCWYRPANEAWYNADWKTFQLKQKKYADGRLSPSLVMDENARLLPDVKRWPSAADGVGFKAMADYVHAKGMKFGIHIMRGMPREALSRNLVVKGTDINVSDIVNKLDTCPWMNHMYGVDIDLEGAQEYYNSLFDLYAEWEVDFIKADDMMVPPYREGEIEMMRKAIDNSGRDMVLSLSCGEAPLSQAQHLSDNANMWRMSKDFWDRWQDVERMFELAEMWSPFIGNGTWPDADMIPIGRLNLSGYPGAHKNPKHPHIEHDSRLTENEQRALMSLWCIMRSPLMWGGDPLTSSKEAVDMISNKSVLDVSRNSENNRQIYERRDSRVWMADISDSEDKYLGLFNMKDEKADVLFELFWDRLKGKYQVVDLWSGQNLGIISERLEVELQAHEGRLYRLIPVDLSNKIAIVVEAEDFFEQTLTEKREWKIINKRYSGDDIVDGDEAHYKTASGKAYLELLPDTRRTHGDKLIKGENFCSTPGEVAVVSYKVNFDTPGRYYVWVRAYSTGSEDNGIHVGINGQWPESGKRMQWCQGKHTWTWESKQRTSKQHCGVPGLVYLDVPEKGEHIISFSMREDGFEFDQFCLSTAYVKPE